MGDEMEPEAGSESQDPEDDISWDDVQEELDRAKEASGATDAPASAEERPRTSLRARTGESRRRPL